MKMRACMALAGAIVYFHASECHSGMSIEVGGFLLSGSDLSFEPLAPGSLLQLIDLGPDGIFNPLTFEENGNGAQWVSGDDRLLLVSFSIPVGTPDFATAAAFDLAVGSDTAGRLSRIFMFEADAIPVGTKVGLRWFPGIAASTFDPLIPPIEGQIYGEFTRQTSTLHGGAAWVTPGDFASLTFDPLLTVSQGGQDPNTAGLPSHTVTVVPEPASLGLCALGGIYLIARRPRQRRE